MQPSLQFCSRTLVPLAKREELLKKVRAPSRSYLDRKALHKRIVALCRKSLSCAACGTKNGVVKKAVGTVLKIVHVIAPGPPEAFADAVKDNKELEGSPIPTY